MNEVKPNKEIKKVKKIRSLKKVGIFTVAGSIFVFLLAIFFLFPFYWMITNSLQTETALFKLPPDIFPINPTIENYKALFKTSTLRWIFNSIFVSAVTSFIVCFISALAGYSFAKKRFPGGKVIFWVMIATMALPRQVILVTQFILMRDMKLINTYPGLILPAVGWAFGVFLMKQFIQTLPSEIIDAGRIDGCSEYGIFSKVILPMAKPGLGALAIFTFMSSWNDYLWQLIMISSDSLKTLPLGVAGLIDQSIVDYGLIMTGSVLASAPMILMFIVFQKYFTKGVTLGAVKG